MANKTKYMYGDQYKATLPGSDQEFYFRNLTEYVVDENNVPTGESKTTVYYAATPGARTASGETWTDGTADSLENFSQGGWVSAATTTDGGATYTFNDYTQEDSDVGVVPRGKEVGDTILGDTAQQSLSTPGGVFYESTQSAILSTLYDEQTKDTDPAPAGLGNVVSKKQQNITERENATLNGAVSDPMELKGIEVGKANVRTQYGTYYYPEDLQNNKQDRIIFTMKSVKGSDINTRFGAEDPITRTFGSITGSVTLPIQPSISDDNSVDWQGSTLNPIGAFAAGASMKLMQSEAADLGKNVGNILGGISKELRKNESYSKALKVYLAQEAVGLQGLLSRTTGAILNPNMELLFNSPALRPFSFTFRLSPRSSSEAKQVRNIIRFFKQGMSVKTTDSSVFLKAPNVFDLRYESYDVDGNVIKDHPSLNRIKTCALTACNVNYTPDGTYMTFNDEKRTMTSYELTLNFTELDPIYDSDYSDSSGNEVSDTSSIKGFNPDSTAIGTDDIGF